MEIQQGLYYTDEDVIFISSDGINHGKGIRLHNQVYAKSNLWNLERHKLRMCNAKEIEHLNQCILKGEYVNYPNKILIAIW